MVAVSRKHIMVNSSLRLLLCTLGAIGLAYLLWLHSEVTHPLLPAAESRYPWHAVTGTDTRGGGGSELRVEEETYSLEYEFVLDDTYAYPYAHLGMWFDLGNSVEELMDWSLYSHMQLTVRCEPRNVLLLILHNYDPQVTSFDNFDTFRPSQALFTCESDWQTITIAVQQFITPEWWLVRSNLNISDTGHNLEYVKGLSLGNTSQSPVAVTSSVKIAAFTLNGRNWALLTAGCVILGLLWLGVVYWTLLQRTKALLAQEQERVKRESLNQTYQPIAIDSKKDKERRAALKLMATEFTNPDMDLELALSRLGTNRTKLNAILKEETGMTFSACLNHLRLTEASRLLLETDLSVAEIAFKVGYNNASYFNRVFRKQFDCTPGEYKQKPHKPAEMPSAIDPNSSTKDD